MSNYKSLFSSSLVSKLFESQEENFKLKFSLKNFNSIFFEYHPSPNILIQEPFCSFKKVSSHNKNNFADKVYKRKIIKSVYMNMIK